MCWILIGIGIFIFKILGLRGWFIGGLICEGIVVVFVYGSGEVSLWV